MKLATTSVRFENMAPELPHGNLDRVKNEINSLVQRIAPSLIACLSNSLLVELLECHTCCNTELEPAETVVS